MLDFSVIFIYNIGAMEKSTQKHRKTVQPLKPKKTEKRKKADQVEKKKTNQKII